MDEKKEKAIKVVEKDKKTIVKNGKIIYYRAKEFRDTYPYLTDSAPEVRYTA